MSFLVRHIHGSALKPIHSYHPPFRNRERQHAWQVEGSHFVAPLLSTLCHATNSSTVPRWKRKTSTLTEQYSTHSSSLVTFRDPRWINCCLLWKMSTFQSWCVHCANVHMPHGSMFPCMHMRSSVQICMHVGSVHCQLPASDKCKMHNVSNLLRSGHSDSRHVLFFCLNSKATSLNHLHNK
jgi:hypothetical protein